MLKLKNNKKGFVLLIVLIMIITATMIGLYALTNSGIEINIAGNKRIIDSVFNAADAGWRVVVRWFIDSDQVPVPDNYTTKSSANDEIDNEYLSGSIDNKHSFSNTVNFTGIRSTPPAGWDVKLYATFDYEIESEGRYIPVNVQKTIEVDLSKVGKKGYAS